MMSKTDPHIYPIISDSGFIGRALIQSALVRKKNTLGPYYSFLKIFKLMSFALILDHQESKVKFSFAVGNNR
jgi:predicted transcriptional regulator